MIIDCISDLHGHFPKLEGGDLLIIAGDLTAKDTLNEYFECFHWIEKQKYKKKILISGNHDNLLANEIWLLKSTNDFSYLCDSSTEFEGLKIWGSPWTKTFHGMNPRCKAFTYDTEIELSQKWDMIPKDIDILITHSPPYGILDKNVHRFPCGSQTLIKNILDNKSRSLHVFGHIHEAHGMKKNRSGGFLVNASYVNEDYEPVNKSIRIEL